MTPKPCLVVPMMLCAAACATTAPASAAYNEALLERHLLDDVKARAYAESRPACSRTQSYSIGALPADEMAALPTLISDCIPSYPQLLQETGYQADCVVTFDIADGGEPTRLVSNCVTWNNDIMIDEPERFMAHANIVMELAAARAIAQVRYVAIGEERAGVRRSNIARRISFRYLDDAQ